MDIGVIERWGVDRVIVLVNMASSSNHIHVPRNFLVNTEVVDSRAIKSTI